MSLGQDFFQDNDNFYSIYRAGYIPVDLLQTRYLVLVLVRLMLPILQCKPQNAIGHDPSSKPQQTKLPTSIRSTPHSRHVYTFMSGYDTRIYLYGFTDPIGRSNSILEGLHPTTMPMSGWWEYLDILSRGIRGAQRPRVALIPLQHLLHAAEAEAEAGKKPMASVRVCDGDDRRWSVGPMNE